MLLEGWQWLLEGQGQLSSCSGWARGWGGELQEGRPEVRLLIEIQQQPLVQGCSDTWGGTGACWGVVVLTESVSTVR